MDVCKSVHSPEEGSACLEDTLRHRGESALRTLVGSSGRFLIAIGRVQTQQIGGAVSLNLGSRQPLGETQQSKTVHIVAESKTETNEQQCSDLVKRWLFSRLSSEGFVSTTTETIKNIKAVQRVRKLWSSQVPTPLKS